MCCVSCIPFNILHSMNSDSWDSPSACLSFSHSFLLSLFLFLSLSLSLSFTFTLHLYLFLSCFLPSRLRLQNTPTVSLQRGKTPAHNECHRYDTKQFDGVVPVMLEFCTPSLSLLPSPFWPGVVALDRVLSMGLIELNCVLMLNWIT